MAGSFRNVVTTSILPSSLKSANAKSPQRIHFLNWQKHCSAADTSARYTLLIQNSEPQTSRTLSNPLQSCWSLGTQTPNVGPRELIIGYFRPLACFQSKRRPS